MNTILLLPLSVREFIAELSVVARVSSHSSRTRSVRSTAQNANSQEVDVRAHPPAWQADLVLSDAVLLSEPQHGGRWVA